MRVGIDISAWRRTKWHEYLIRFGLGGTVTVLAALIAKRFGAGVGGLFLAFPSIFPSAATLIASHEKRKKAEEGMSGSVCARKLAAADAAGAAMGGLGLAGFAAVARWAIQRHSTVETLAAATVVWALLSFLAWEFREVFWRRIRHKFSQSHIAKVERHDVSHQGNRQQN